MIPRLLSGSREALLQPSSSDDEEEAQPFDQLPRCGKGVVTLLERLLASTRWCTRVRQHLVDLREMERGNDILVDLARGKIVEAAPMDHGALIKSAAHRSITWGILVITGLFVTSAPIFLSRRWMIISLLIVACETMLEGLLRWKVWRRLQHAQHIRAPLSLRAVILLRLARHLIDEVAVAPRVRATDTRYGATAVPASEISLRKIVVEERLTLGAEALQKVIRREDAVLDVPPCDPLADAVSLTMNAAKALHSAQNEWSCIEQLTTSREVALSSCFLQLIVHAWTERSALTETYASSESLRIALDALHEDVVFATDDALISDICSNLRTAAPKMPTYDGLGLADISRRMVGRLLREMLAAAETSNAADTHDYSACCDTNFIYRLHCLMDLCKSTARHLGMQSITSDTARCDSPAIAEISVVGEDGAEGGTADMADRRPAVKFEGSSQGMDAPLFGSALTDGDREAFLSASRVRLPMGPRRQIAMLEVKE